MQPDAGTIVVQLNGRPHTLREPASVAALISGLELRSEQVAVERNGEVVRRAAHASTMLSAGDVIEVVTLVGGG